MGLEVKLPLRRVKQLSGRRSEKTRRVESAARSLDSGNSLQTSARDREQECAADPGFLTERGRHDVVRF